jgi:hypothetical protein
MSIKLTFEKETHLCRQRPQTFVELCKLATEQYKTLSAVAYFYYIDEEGDRISIYSDEDLISLYDSVPQGKTPKIVVQREDPNNSN